MGLDRIHQAAKDLELVAKEGELDRARGLFEKLMAEFEDLKAQVLSATGSRSKRLAIQKTF